MTGCDKLVSRDCLEGGLFKDGLKNGPGHRVTDYACRRIRIGHEEAGAWSFCAQALPRLMNCRSRLVWRYAGEQAWRDDYLPLPASGPCQTDPALMAHDLSIRVVAQETHGGGWEFSGSLSNLGERAVELARFHYLDGMIEYPAEISAVVLLMQEPVGTQYHFPPGQEIPPIRQTPRNPKHFWEVPAQDKRLPDPIYDEPNWICGIDSAVFCRGGDAEGWIMGATGPGIAFGEVALRSAGPDAGHFFAGQLLDNILLTPEETRDLERMLVLAGEWQNGLRAWAGHCADAMGASRPRPPLTGFCSWYHDLSGFTTDYIDQAIEQFAELPLPPGGRMIQIDDGFQRAPGDWRPSERLAKDWWDSLPGRIAATGSIPSLWLAPLTVQDTNPIVREHPEWFQRLPDGRFAVTFMNWGYCDDPTWKFAEPGGHLAHNLDPDHPDARAFIALHLREAVQAGWRAFKFDFNVFASARQAYDRRKTVFETLRNEYQFFRETVGPDVLLNACLGGTWRYAVGLADSQRIGSDMIGRWEFIRDLLPGLLLRMLAFNGIWWTADPDVFYMRHVNTTITSTYLDPMPLSTSEEEQSMLLTAIGLMGGMLYTSDLPSEWTPGARKKILQFWGRDIPGPVANPRLVFDPETHLPIAGKSERTVDGQRRIICALFNWGESEATISVSLEELGLDRSADYLMQPSAEDIQLAGGVLTSRQPPHSARSAILTT